MEYLQERVATLHEYDSVQPEAPVDRATVVVPLTGRDHGSLAAERVFSRLEAVKPGRVLVALQADRERVGATARWIESFDLPVTVLWCTAPRIESRLEELGLDGHAGKGRDVWLGLGVASDSEYVVVHDADAMNYDETLVPKLLFPLARDYEFVKGYYARVENDRLYGRLFRLFYVPLLRTLRDEHEAPVVAYLSAFRYALAGEFALTGNLARRVRTPRGWGLEVGTLGDAFDVAGFEGTAQVDLGVHEHDHRSVGGPDGLGTMCAEVGATLFNVLEEHGVEPAYERLPARYREIAKHLVEQYAADAAFNDLVYDRSAEREQIVTYAESINRPTDDDRLPSWREAPLDAGEIERLSAAALEDRRN